MQIFKGSNEYCWRYRADTILSTDGQGETSIPPFQLHWSRGYNESLQKYSMSVSFPSYRTHLGLTYHIYAWATGGQQSWMYLKNCVSLWYVWSWDTSLKEMSLYPYTGHEGVLQIGCRTIWHRKGSPGVSPVVPIYSVLITSEEWMSEHKKYFPDAGIPIVKIRQLWECDFCSVYFLVQWKVFTVRLTYDCEGFGSETNFNI